MNFCLIGSFTISSGFDKICLFLPSPLTFFYGLFLLTCFTNFPIGGNKFNISSSPELRTYRIGLPFSRMCMPLKKRGALRKSSKLSISESEANSPKFKPFSFTF